MVKVYFGPNRKPNRKKAPDDFGQGFSDDGLANLRFGMAEVTGDGLDNYDFFLAPERLRKDAARKIKGGKGSVLGSKTSSNASARRLSIMRATRWSSSTATTSASRKR